VPCTTPSEKENSTNSRGNIVEDEWLALTKEVHGTVNELNNTNLLINHSTLHQKTIGNQQSTINNQ
jgi:hypothetical protein